MDELKKRYLVASSIAYGDIKAARTTSQSTADGHAQQEIRTGTPDVSGKHRGRPAWRRCRDLVGTIIARASEPWVPLQLGGVALAEVRPGGIVLLVGGTGRGKTSLVATLMVEHARSIGPAIALSLELPADEWTARAIGVGAGESWPDVLRAQVPPERMVSAIPERLVVVERQRDPLQVLGAAIDATRTAHPDEPVLVAIDYVQLLATEDRELRRAVGEAMREVDELARSRQVVVVAVSQGSRASSRALSSGERIGADTTDAGAESADLERWASLTLAIGHFGAESDDGSRSVELSIGKSRMGAGDSVIDARFSGRTGAWQLTGEPKQAAELRVSRKATRRREAVVAAKARIVEAAEKSPSPMTREDLRSETKLARDVFRDASTELLAAGELVEVRHRRPRARDWQLWTRANAERARIAVVEGE